MDKPTGSPQFYLASSVTEKTLVANSEERLISILATLEECQGALVASGNRETAQLVSVAILELRIKLNRIADSELKALCDAMVRDVTSAEPPHEKKLSQGQGGCSAVALKLVK